MNNNIKKVKNVLLIILFANVFVAVLKIVIGSIAKSASLTADGFHSLSDGASNIVGLVGIWFASKPVDEDHPYGHGKFETLAGLFIGGMLTIVGVNVITKAFQKFNNPVTPNITLEGIIALFITLLVNIFVSKVEYREGKKLSSQILISDSLHTKSDVYVSIGVIITLIGIKLGLPPIIDPIASLVVGGFIFHAAYEIFVDTSGVLVDKAVINPEKIKNIALEFEEVKDAHKIRSRGAEDEIYIDLHIMVDAYMSVEDSHTLATNIENRVKEELGENSQVILHLEPYYEVR
ncbi:cation diffusion facilitator family transporter [Clostridium peptidivorans]|uniref:cation diffusion facilitator family transporter n=1 Tax=Clostridium peptidivorans TaxID=100174 RepID=UPI000BE376FF|nr:cation diffusion facilitator family transporter [Clostridium peptidivorans]